MEEILAEAAGEVRRIEKTTDQILSVVRHLEDSLDPDEVREAADTLSDAIDWLQGVVAALEDIANRAEQAAGEEDELCPECGFFAASDGYGGYCSFACQSRNN